MKVNEQIAIMKAYEDGKTIEKKGQDDTEWQSIEYIEDYPFDFFCEQYRIKREPNYRPYESVDEAFNEAKRHGFWLKHKLSVRICFLTSFFGRTQNYLHKLPSLSLLFRGLRLA